MNAPMGGGATYYPASQPIYQPAGGYPPQPGYYPPGPPPPPNPMSNGNFAMNRNYNMQAARIPTQDPDEAFKVNSPPPYEEIVKQQRWTKIKK